MAAEDQIVRILVRPEDNKCEGCGDPLGDDFDETEDMVILCRLCADLTE